MRAGDRIGRGIALSAASFACFSAADAAVKWLTSGYSVFQISMMTAVFAMVPVAFLVSRTGGMAVLKPRNPKAVTAISLLLLIDTVSIYWAFSRLPLANVYTLVFTPPLIITALTPFIIKEKVGPHRWASVLAGFVGVVVILRPGMIPLDIGYASAALAALTWALALIIIRQVGDAEPDGTIVFWSFIAKIIVPGIVTLFVFRGMGPADIGLVALAGMLVGIAHIFMVQAFKCAPGPVVSPFQYTQMIWAVIFGFFLWGDLPDAYVIAGSAIVAAAGLYILWREQIAAKPSTATPEA
ncbi:MAG: DMT family transporter [Rhodospirillales bacterium]|nr:DMT family transporter [Rhodospirillales bacterium]